MFQTIRNLGLLMLFGVVAAAGLKYVYQGQGFGSSAATGDGRIVERGTAAGARADTAEPSREMVLRPESNGHYFLTAEIDGVEVRFLVDTGASYVALTPRDGRRLGLDDGLLDYTDIVQTANGHTHGSRRSMIDDMRIGQLQVDERPRRRSTKSQMRRLPAGHVVPAQARRLPGGRRQV